MSRSHPREIFLDDPEYSDTNTEGFILSQFLGPSVPSCQLTFPFPEFQPPFPSVMDPSIPQSDVSFALASSSLSLNSDSQAENRSTSTSASPASKRAKRGPYYKGKLPEGWTHDQAIASFTAEVSDWQGTHNNYSPNDLFQMMRLTDHTLPMHPDLEYIAWQEEIGPISGTPHLQFFLQCKRTRTIHYVRTILGFEKLPFLQPRAAHMSPSDCSNYCKDPSKRKPLGASGGKGVLQLRAQGITRARNSNAEAVNYNRGGNGTLAEVTNLLTAGVSADVLRRRYPTLWVQFGRGLDDLALSLAVPRSGRTEVVLLLGTAGTGKSTYARAKWPKAYWVSPPNKKGGAVWYPSYKGETTLIYDDFDGYVDMDSMLRICDGHPFIVQGKGSSFQLQAREIIFTSTQYPETWWPDDNLEARGFFRRISRSYRFTIDQHRVRVTRERPVPPGCTIYTAPTNIASVATLVESADQDYDEAQPPPYQAPTHRTPDNQDQPAGRSKESSRKDVRSNKGRQVVEDDEVD